MAPRTRSGRHTSTASSRRRTSTLSSSALSSLSGTPTPGPEDDVQDELNRQTELRNKLLEVERLKQEIRELHQRTFGDQQVSTTPPASEPQQEQEQEQERAAKRMRDNAGEPVARGPRAKDPDRYKGKSLKELEIFLRDCRNVIRIEERYFTNETKEVYWAVTFLDGDPADAWGRYERETRDVNNGVYTWKEFETFLRDMQADPMNRLITTIQKYEDARQQERQTAQNFSLYLEELEALLPPYSEQQRTSHLFTKLRPSLKNEILSKGNIPSTRRELLAVAQRFEGMVKVDQKYQPNSYNSSQSTSYKGRHESTSTTNKSPNQQQEAKPNYNRPHQSHPNKGPNLSESNRTPVGDEHKKGVECYNCHKKGHYKRECNSRTQSEKAGTGH